MECNLCKSNSKTIKKVIFNNEVYHLCRKCRSNNGHEDKEDIIEGFKENLKTPHEIVKYLDQYVIGQAEVKKNLAVEIYNHFLRIINQDEIENEEIFIQKNNILLAGPSGSGKTLMLRKLAEYLNIPFAIVSATTLTESGYVGNDVESVLSSLYNACNRNVSKTQCGIIYIDEIDKKLRKGESTSITRDVSGEGVQQAMLAMLDGAKVAIPPSGGRINPSMPLVEIDTSNILFICGGAFEEIEDVVQKRLNKNKSGTSIGFNADKSKTIDWKDSFEEYKKIRLNITEKDLMEFGLIKEFIGRFPIQCNFEPLNAEALVKILRAKQSVLESYENLFKLNNKSLDFSDNTLRSIADEAIKKNVGARGLSKVISTFLNDLMYNFSDDIKDYNIDKSMMEAYL